MLHIAGSGPKPRAPEKLRRPSRLIADIKENYRAPTTTETDRSTHGPASEEQEGCYGRHA